MNDPTGPAAGKTTITIHSLNLECLEKIVSYLEGHDVLRVYEADPLFQEAARRQFTHSKDIKIDDIYYDRIPHALYECTRHWKKIWIYDLPQEKFAKLVPYLEAVEDLTLSKMTLDQPTMLPRNLHTLSVLHCQISWPVASSWQPHLNLKSLTCFCGTFAHAHRFGFLRNLERLTLMGELSPPSVGEILDNNLETLKELVMLENDGQVNFSLWGKILKMSNLERLMLNQKTIHQSGDNCTWTRAGFLPKLRSLACNFNAPLMVRFIEDLGCADTLEELALDTLNIERPELMPRLDRFPRLRLLETSGMLWGMDYAQRHPPLTQVRTWTLNPVDVETGYNLLRCAAPMPNLQDVRVVVGVDPYPMNVSKELSAKLDQIYKAFREGTSLRFGMKFVFLQSDCLALFPGFTIRDSFYAFQLPNNF